MKTCKSEGCVNSKPQRGTLCNPCRNLRQRYNLTVPERTKLLESQDFKCKLCSRQIAFDGTARQYSACIDHDHISGKIRGVLCGNCNTWLGYAENQKISPDDIKKYIQG
jgi:hypothetical protein